MMMMMTTMVATRQFDAQRMGRKRNMD